MQDEPIPPPPCPRPRMHARTCGSHNGADLQHCLPSRAQHLPLVCRQWRTVLSGTGSAWRRLQMHWAISESARNGAFFTFCSRTRCVEVRAE